MENPIKSKKKSVFSFFLFIWQEAEEAKEERAFNRKEKTEKLKSDTIEWNGICYQRKWVELALFFRTRFCEIWIDASEWVFKRDGMMKFSIANQNQQNENNNKNKGAHAIPRKFYRYISVELVWW